MSLNEEIYIFFEIYFSTQTSRTWRLRNITLKIQRRRHTIIILNKLSMHNIRTNFAHYLISHYAKTEATYYFNFTVTQKFLGWNIDWLQLVLFLAQAYKWTPCFNCVRWSIEKRMWNTVVYPDIEIGRANMRPISERVITETHTHTVTQFPGGRKVKKYVFLWTSPFFLA